MELGLRGKVAIVTAASRGMGRAVARELSSEGALVAISSRSAEHMKLVAAEIESETGNVVLPIVCDLTQSDQIKSMVQSVVEKFGGVDILVANAGGPPRGKFSEIADDQWQAAFELTFMSVVRLVRGVVPSMTARGGGRIITISSSSVKQPIPNLLVSNALRPGVLGLLKTLAEELAPHNILVNNLSPGRINTERLQENDAAQAAKTGASVADVQEASYKRIPLRRYGYAEEVAAVITFMASARASYMTGTTVVVDGGYIKALS